MAAYSESTFIGNETEKLILDMILQSPDVETAHRDSYNSKHDIYFKLKGESEFRGIQVKTMGIKNTKIKPKKTRGKPKTSYRINHLDRYVNGTLVACLCPSIGDGIIFIMSDEYQCTTGSATVGGEYKFAILICENSVFIERLHSHLFLAPISKIEDDLYDTALKEYESTMRFMEMCKQHQIECSRVEDSSNVTDLIVAGYKIQMKYASNPQSPKTGTYAYRLELGRSIGKSFYKKGDNDFYIVELGSCHGHFLILSEQLLIEYGMITTGSQKGRKNLNVYPYDYVETKTQSKTGPRIRGNWSCDKALWCNSEIPPRFEYIEPQYFRKIRDCEMNGCVEVKSIDKYGDEIIYKSVVEASQYNKCSLSVIFSSLRYGTLHKGLKWEYEDPEHKPNRR